MARAAEIAGYIAADRPDAAERWVRDLFAKVGALRQQPRRGRKAPELGRDEVREVLYGEYNPCLQTDGRPASACRVAATPRCWF